MKLVACANMVTAEANTLGKAKRLTNSAGRIVALATRFGDLKDASFA